MHPMKRIFLIFVFSLGTVGGFAHGFLSLGHCASGHRDRRAEFEDHVAEVCTRAANRVNDNRASAWVAPPFATPRGMSANGLAPAAVTVSPAPITISGPAVITVSAPPAAPVAVAPVAVTPVIETAPAASPAE